MGNEGLTGAQDGQDRIIRLSWPLEWMEITHHNYLLIILYLLPTDETVTFRNFKY